MFIDNFVTKYEIDERMFIYTDGRTIKFDEIERIVQEKVRNIKIMVHGDYFKKLDPVVYIQANFNGYSSKIVLDKKILIREDSINYIEYLANHLVRNISYQYFGR